MSKLLVPVSPGELIDKITILEIKSVRFSDEKKLKNVGHELELLQKVWADSGQQSTKISILHDQLRAVNEHLWQVEDDIRLKEARGEFDESFIELARSVYRHNDWRADLKKQINRVLGSELVEEKGYQSY